MKTVSYVLIGLLIVMLGAIFSQAVLENSINGILFYVKIFMLLTAAFILLSGISKFILGTKSKIISNLMAINSNSQIKLGSFLVVVKSQTKIIISEIRIKDSSIKEISSTFVNLEEEFSFETLFTYYSDAPVMVVIDPKLRNLEETINKIYACLHNSKEIPRIFISGEQIAKVVSCKLPKVTSSGKQLPEGLSSVLGIVAGLTLPLDENLTLKEYK